MPDPAVADAAQISACQTTTSVVESVGPAVAEPAPSQMVEVLEAMAAGGDPPTVEPRAAVSLGAVEAVLDPKRLLAALKRPPFEPGKPRYTSGAWRIDWATLLKRVSDVDALACPCGGRLKFVEVVTEAHRARELLERFGLNPQAATVPRARSPTLDFDPPSPDDW